MTNDEWIQLSDLCFGNNVLQLSGHEQAILKGFGTAGSVFVWIWGLGYLSWYILDNQHPAVAQMLRKKAVGIRFGRNKDAAIISLLLVVIPILTIPQIRGVFRLREIQGALAESTDDSYTDDEWGFGQIVAVLLFAPVSVNVVYAWIEGRCEFSLL